MPRGPRSERRVDKFPLGARGPAPKGRARPTRDTRRHRHVQACKIVHVATKDACLLATWQHVTSPRGLAARHTWRSPHLQTTSPPPQVASRRRRHRR